MQLYIPNVTEQQLVFFDIEYDQTSLVQLAVLIFDKIDTHIFKLKTSANIYFKQRQPLNPFFVRYTGITDEFLQDFGVDELAAKELQDELLAAITSQPSLLVSHGIKNDLLILDKNGFAWKDAAKHYCTYTSAKRLLHRGSNLTLKDVAQEDGYFIYNEHNAYADVWGLLHAFCYLNEKENLCN